MIILKNILLYIITSLYIWLYGDEQLEVRVINTVKFDMKIKGKVYHCVCKESQFNITFAKRLTLNKSVSLYHVQMRMEGDGMYTEGWYPMLTPSVLKDTEYPTHVAIKAHWRTYYS